MKRVFLATVGVLALAATAGAADLSTRRYNPPPAYMPLYNWTGFYLGLNGGAAWGRSRWSGTGTGNFNLSGGMIGGTIGYNWQNGPWVFGLEGDIDWTNIGGTTTTACAVGCKTQNSWLATARGRVGYAINRFMPFVTGGLAVGDIDARVGGVSAATNTNAGWTVGGGLEFAIAGGWTAKAEYLYVDLGNFNCGVACTGVTPDNVSFHAHIARGGVNFRF